MKVHYNIRKEARKAMVATVGTAVGAKPAYCGAPSFSYKVDAFEIAKDGSLCFDDALDEATVARVRTALREAGFTAEDGENEASCADTGADEPIQTETAENEPAAIDTAEIELSQTKTAADEPTAVETEADEQIQMETSEEPVPTEEAMAEADEDSLSISLPRSLFTETALKNLDALLLSKGRLIRHAFDIREATSHGCTVRSPMKRQRRMPHSSASSAKWHGRRSASRRRRRLWTTKSMPSAASSCALA